MSRQPPTPTALRVADLASTGPTAFAHRPDAAELARIADDLNLSALRKLSFEGTLRPMGKTDWHLDAHLGATVVQPCVVTLEPVTTRIDIPVTRRFLADYSDPDDPEVEMPEDDTTEALGAWIDPNAVMQEALALALPDYPRSDAARLGAAVFTEPGKAPMTDDDAKPFAGLAGLRDTLGKQDD